MPTKTKSHLNVGSTTFRARLAKLEDKVADRSSGEGGELSELDIAERKRILEALKISDTTLATAIFRIVQEAMTNVMRHAAASQVNVSLEKKDKILVLEVRDNGIGIKEGRIFDSKSLGLTGIRERVLLLGGEAVISGKSGEGTVVRVTLPFEEVANPNT